MGQEAEDTGTLQETTFKRLYDSGMLPSGAPFELMPDTVEVALAVAEVNDPYQWKKKAIQAFTVTKTVADIDVQEAGPQFMFNMLDTDVIFLSLAWTAQLNGTKLDIDDGGIPCPTCNHPFRHVDFGDLKAFVRGAQASGPNIFPVKDVSDDLLPKSMQGGQLAIGDMTWMHARKSVSEQSWENTEAVKMHRVLAGLRLMKEGGHPRDVMRAESKKMRARVLREAAIVMDKNVPHFDMKLEMKCANCGEISIVPFTQGLG